ncbi:M23 family metallopeptidase [Oscillatoria sp. CS-180]|uniref:peptidoglycan DD-metalloendopeptidase family protein n=1 Tax=Oscillatoria sp. CS-180 TaxID=3021720 RepID=UPI002331354E|nr:M23 family metallopeptidase [Oscillatoria sp. CS-180]MDB9526376.1 M23 family metallopeptidase [Oscillatoria sp. CS-180]
MRRKLIQSFCHIGRRIAIYSTGVASLPVVSFSLLGSAAIAQTTADLCPVPVLSRVQSHQVASGETIDSIAADYGLLPVTVMAMNPSVQRSAVSPGTSLRIPPFNGVEVAVSEGQTWQDVAAAYQARADVLFEVNGCPEAMPNRVFVPGVSWLVESNSTSGVVVEETNLDNDPLSAYPLSPMGTIVKGYGWQADIAVDQLTFSSGVTLEAAMETTVLAAGSGTVAYVGEEATLGTLIVINHDDGLQTRYGFVTAPTVSVGEQVTAGQAIAAAAPQTEETTSVYFEVRTNSDLGWIARDPGDYIPELAIR